MQIVTCWTPLNAEGTKRRKSTSVRALGSKKAEVQETSTIERPRARYVCTVCGCTYCSNNCIVTPSLAHSHTVTQPVLTPKITHPSPAALCAILPTLRENKGLLVSLCCTSGEDRTGTRLMLSLPASKPQSPHKGSLGISLREDRTETRLMLSLPAATPHSPHKRSLVSF